MNDEMYNEMIDQGKRIDRIINSISSKPIGLFNNNSNNNGWRHFNVNDIPFNKDIEVMVTNESNKSTQKFLWVITTFGGEWDCLQYSLSADGNRWENNRSLLKDKHFLNPDLSIKWREDKDQALYNFIKKHEQESRGNDGSKNETDQLEDTKKANERDKKIISFMEDIEYKEYPWDDGWSDFDINNIQPGDLSELIIVDKDEMKTYSGFSIIVRFYDIYRCLIFPNDGNGDFFTLEDNSYFINPNTILKTRPANYSNIFNGKFEIKKTDIEKQ